MPLSRLTHSGKDIPSLKTERDIAQELMQEALEAVVFGLLAVVMGLDGENRVGGFPLIATVMALMLAFFCLDRVVVIFQLLSRLSQIDNPDID